MIWNSSILEVNNAGEMDFLGSREAIWEQVFQLYNKALKKKSEKMKDQKRKELISLDKWYQHFWCST